METVGRVVGGGETSGMRNNLVSYNASISVSWRIEPIIITSKQTRHSITLMHLFFVDPL